jgi:hypothetical protein
LAALAAVLLILALVLASRRALGALVVVLVGLRRARRGGFGRLAGSGLTGVRRARRGGLGGLAGSGLTGLRRARRGGLGGLAGSGLAGLALGGLGGLHAPPCTTRGGGIWLPLGWFCGTNSICTTAIR